jgi:DNA-binding NarL/FixJ family response regulator
LEVVRAICQGLTNKEIAREMSLTLQSVKNYITSILRTTGAVDRCQVAYWFAKWECEAAA